MVNIRTQIPVLTSTIQTTIQIQVRTRAAQHVIFYNSKLIKIDFVPRLPVDELDGLALAGKGRRPYTVPKGTNPKSSYFN
jgi:hypothetical protein